VSQIKLDWIGLDWIGYLGDLCCRSVGDLGLIEAVNGVVDVTIHDHLVSMFGNYSVIGRSLMVSIVRN